MSLPAFDHRCCSAVTAGRRPAGRAAIDRYLLPVGPTAANKPQRHTAARWPSSETAINTESDKKKSDVWLLKLNIDKCKSVSYCIKHPTDTGYRIMYRNQLLPLEKVKSVVELGIRFHSNRTVRDHISEKKLRNLTVS